MGSRGIHVKRPNFSRGAAGSQYALIVGLVAVIAIVAIAGTGGSIKSLFGSVSNQLGGVSNNTAAAPSAPAPDTTQPSISSISPPANANYATGQTLNFTVNYSEPVIVSGGSPILNLVLTSGSRTATYASGSGSAALIFNYTIQSGDSDLDGIQLTSPISLGGSSIADAAGNAALLTFTPPSLAGVTINTGVRSFSNCSATGQSGPSQSQCDSAYAATALAGTVSVSGGYQSWTVPVTGTYRIEAWGAEGGAAVQLGGKGAYVAGSFSLTSGQVLRILVGQMGGVATNSTQTGRSASGGGGTFVVNNSTGTLLLAAGGGGGAGVNDSGTPSPTARQVGMDGVAGQTSGTAGNQVIATAGSPGSGGGGGQQCSSSGVAAGAGYTGNSVAYGGSWATAALSYTNGGTGSYSANSTTYGGFGGGGAGAFGGGGGGGYSGGGCGSYFNASSANSRDHGGGGGGSFISGSSTTGQDGVRSGHGQVIITPP